MPTPIVSIHFFKLNAVTSKTTLNQNIFNATFYDQANKPIATSETIQSSNGDSTSTYKDIHGNRIGQSSTDQLSNGDATTTYKDLRGNEIGKSSTDQRSNGDSTTTYRDMRGNKLGTAENDQRSNGTCTTMYDFNPPKSTKTNNNAIVPNYTGSPNPPTMFMPAPKMQPKAQPEPHAKNAGKCFIM